jgi:hypothetical protein
MSVIPTKTIAIISAVLFLFTNLSIKAIFCENHQRCHGDVEEVQIFEFVMYVTFGND